MRNISASLFKNDQDYHIKKNCIIFAVDAAT